MLPKNFEGNTPTIEDVFHSLNTRLSFIKSGIAKNGKYYNGNDYECNPQDAIFDIQSKVHGYNPALALGEIENSLDLIDKIQKAIDEIPKGVESGTSDSWSVATDYTTNLKDELTQYNAFLEELQEDLWSRENSIITNSDASFKKIQVSIKVEQLAGLIYFLFKDNIFKSKLTPLCVAFEKILSQDTGEDFTSGYLRNKVYDSIKDGDIVNFWKHKFSNYIYSINTIPKK